MKKILVSIFILTVISCTWDEIDVAPPPTYYEIWSGPDLIFEKGANTDPNNALNQDNITPSVAITRGNNGGHIYNAISETQSEKDISPLGTEWAIGDTSNIENLNFLPFRDAVGRPQDVVGKKLVLHIIEENVYLSVEFTSWKTGTGNGNGGNGGFSYVRSTEN